MLDEIMFYISDDINSIRDKLSLNIIHKCKSFKFNLVVFELLF